ncbi:MAG TPA: hypothetical protein VHO25_23210 [Polyangiaceae bacterium]|nr:hypothetical protein [Polyangiaceae bacterium]
MNQLRRIAYHEAGHGVLSAALNDAPRLLSIRETQESLGRSRYEMDVGPKVRVQIHLGGFAAEEILTGHPARQFMGPDLRGSIYAHTHAVEEFVVCRFRSCDQYLAIEELLLMGCPREELSLRNEIAQFYDISKRSLKAVWPAVVSVTRALLKHGELDRRAFNAAVAGHDVYRVIDVQRECGISGKG